MQLDCMIMHNESQEKSGVSHVTNHNDESSLRVQAKLAYGREYAEFLRESPTSFHAAAQIASQLEEAGFSRQDPAEEWDASEGGHYLVSGGAVMAWRVPQGAGPLSSFAIVGAHTDSPTFRLKPSPDSNAYGFAQVNVEPYGGIVPNSWLNREMGIAGRLVLLDGSEVLVRTDAIMVIPQLAPHLDRGSVEKLVLDRQKHLHPVWALPPERSGAQEAPQILATVAAYAKVQPEQIAGFDLFAYDAQGPQIVQNTFIASGRQDNLSSVFAGLTALLNVESAAIQVFAAFDHEEVGSQTATGAQGPLLEMTLRRIAGALGASEEQYYQMIARSTCISADAGHSINPNYAEYHDPDQYPVAGRGPIIKINANQRYCTDAAGQALWLRSAYAMGEDTQEFVSNNAVSCGTTIGPLTATRLGIQTVDVGIPLLSMHSARELAAISDCYGLSRVLMGYWSIAE